MLFSKLSFIFASCALLHFAGSTDAEYFTLIPEIEAIINYCNAELSENGYPTVDAFLRDIDTETALQESDLHRTEVAIAEGILLFEEAGTGAAWMLV